MTCSKKGAGKAERESGIEKLTDESLDKVSGGAVDKCAPDSCFPTMVECDPQHVPHCKPLTPPWEKK